MDSKLVSAVKAVERRGWSPAPLEMIADAARWRGAELEHHLDRLATVDRIERHKQPDCDPAYASREA